MPHDSGVSRLHDSSLARHVGVHVDDGEKVEAEGRGEATKEGAGEQQGVLVGLVIVSQVIIVQNSDPVNEKW